MLVAIALAAAAGQAAEINFDFVRELAAKRAAERYRAPDETLPPRLAALTYDDARAISFRDERALWRAEKRPFQVKFYPRGGLYRTEVVVHEFDRRGARRIPYAAEDFLVEGVPDLPALPPNLGYAGFNVLFPLSGRDSADEVASFLGASYFRAIGAGQRYGLSARGLALDSCLAERREEFPRFAEFWLQPPAAQAKSLTFYALLEGPSVAGAFEFLLTPGPTTTIDVRTALFFRETGKLIGLAPLTSMFWFGENTDRPSGDPRPEVHDSDGLIVQDKQGDELWVPLRNPRALHVTEITVPELTRFGLAQRDRSAANYNDPPIAYERRPTAWIEPRGNWGAGMVRLAEMPATQEYADNIVAFWVPQQPFAPGKPLEVAYRLSWGTEEPHNAQLLRVVATRRIAGTGRRLTYQIDFAAPKAKATASEPVEVDARVDRGARLVRAAAAPYPETGGWRVTLEIEPAADADPKASSVAHCALRRAGQALSETWRYDWEW